MKRANPTEVNHECSYRFFVTAPLWNSNIWFFHRKFLLWAVSQSWRAGEDFWIYESFKVELLQKICKSIHDVLSRMSALHSDDSISAFKNIGISWLQKVLALWMSPDAPKMSLEHHLRSKDHFQAHLRKISTFSKNPEKIRDRSDGWFIEFLLW